MADDSPRIGQQANQTAAFDPDVEEIDFEDLEEEDFAPPPATNSRRETLQVQQLSVGNNWSFGGMSSSKLQARVEVDMEHWGLNQSRSLGARQSNQLVIKPWVSDMQWQQQGMRGVKRGHKYPEIFWHHMCNVKQTHLYCEPFNRG